jgi:hypothetical protein
MTLSSVWNVNSWVQCADEDIWALEEGSNGPLHETAQWVASWCLTLTSSNQGDQIIKNETGGACATLKGKEKCVTGFGEQTWK